MARVSFFKQFNARVISILKVYYNGEVFRNEPIRNKNCLWRPCLLTDRDEMSNIYRGPSIDASYHVSVHLAERFQRRLKCEKLIDDRKQTMDKSDAKSPHYL